MKNAFWYMYPKGMIHRTLQGTKWGVHGKKRKCTGRTWRVLSCAAGTACYKNILNTKPVRIYTLRAFHQTLRPLHQVYFP